MENPSVVPVTISGIVPYNLSFQENDTLSTNTLHRDNTLSVGRAFGDDAQFDLEVVRLKKPKKELPRFRDVRSDAKKRGKSSRHMKY